MLYEIENQINRVISVDHIQWKSMSCHVMPRNYAALAYRVKGDAKILYSNHTVVAHTNDIIYLPQGMEYYAEYSDTEIIVIHFITAKPDIDVGIYTVENCERIFKCFEEILQIWRNKNTGYKCFAMSVLYKILGIVNSEKQESNLPENFINAISFINSNYRRNDISIQNICRESKISESHFRELFLKQYKKTPIAYISELRIDYARNLISGEMSKEKAALKSGFNDSKYFSRVVKKYLHCSPRALKLYGK